MENLEFTVEALEESFLPQYSRSLCKRAIRFVQPTLAAAPPDLVMKLLTFLQENMNEESLMGMINSWGEEGNVKFKPFVDLFEMMEKPLSELITDAEKRESYLSLVSKVEASSPVHPAISQQTEELPIEAALSAVILWQVIFIHSAEKALLEEQQPTPDLKEVFASLEPLSDALEMLYRFALHLESEVKVIQQHKIREEATTARNRPHKELHQEFFEYYEENRGRFSKAECARRFYTQLPSNKQSLYQTEHSAQRQLTEALKKHLSR